PLLEDPERLLEPEIAGLELVHDPLEPLERILKLDVAHPALSLARRERRGRLREAGSRAPRPGAPPWRASRRLPSGAVSGCIPARARRVARGSAAVRCSSRSDDARP